MTDGPASGTAIPLQSSVLCESQIAFCVAVVDRSGAAETLEALLRRRTGRPRRLALRALLVGLLLLATDDRPLHLKAVTRLLYLRLPPAWRERLGVVGEATTTKALLARYRCVRYLFQLAVAVVDPSSEQKNRVLPEAELEALRKKLCEAEVAERAARLQSVLDALLDATVGICSDEELAGFDGSVGLDATPVPLYSRGPSRRAGTSASDPDGGWYVREGDHREATGHSGKPLRKLHWALEATLVQMGRPPGSLPAAHPNLVLALRLRRPGEDPAGTAVGLLASLGARGYRAGLLAVDRGYSQARAEDFHLPVAALGYRLVMDYKTAQLGRQGQSRGGLLVDGAFYCPALPEQLVTCSADHRAGRLDDARYAELLAAREPWRLLRKEGPDHDGFVRYACPAQGERPRLCCPLREEGLRALGRVPVLAPPAEPPAVCTQGSVTIAPDVLARHRQELAYGSEAWRSTYATYRNTTEGANGFLKDAAHESLASPERRRVRGVAAQSLLCCFLVMAGNIRKIAAFRELHRTRLAATAVARARRRRVRLSQFHPRG